MTAIVPLEFGTVGSPFSRRFRLSQRLGAAAFAVTFCFWFCTGALAQGCAVNWREASPCPTPIYGVQISDTACDGSILVRVGPGGYIQTSADGATWVQESCGLNAYFEQVAAGNGVFLATGLPWPAGKRFLARREGGEWSVQWGTSLSSAITFAGGLFFSSERTSPDGRSWTPFYLPTSGSAPFFVAFGSGKWLLLQPFFGQVLAYSSGDARRWQAERLPPFSSISGLAFGGGRFVALADGVYSSKSGLSWKKASIGPPQEAVLAYDHGQFVIVAPGRTWISSNGAKWTTKTSNLPSDALPHKLFWNGSLWILSDKHSDSRTYTSPDAVSWTIHLPCTVPGNAAGRVRFFPEAGIFVSAGSLLTSLDGKSWSAPLTPGTANGVAYGNGRFVAVGPQGKALVSLDGQSWAEAGTGTWEDLLDVAFGHGLFAAVGTNGRVVTSPDGFVWTIRPSYHYEGLQSIVFAENRFVAVGATSGSAVLSEDGLHWREVDLGRPFVSYPGPWVAHALGRFIITSPDGLLASSDGTNWTPTGDIYTSLAGDVVEWNGRAYATAYGGGLYVSEDLQTWHWLETNGLDVMVQGNSLATDGNLLVLGGGGSLLWGTCAPLVRSVEPSSVSAPGETVTLLGRGLSGVTRVRFGDVPATSFSILSDHEIEAVVPPMTPNSIAVSAAAGEEPGVITLDNYFRSFAEPMVFGACPDTLGSTDPYLSVVTVWGKGLPEVSFLRIGGELESGGSGQSEDTIQFSVSPRPEGHVDAEIIPTEGPPLPVPGGLTFVASPTILSVKVVASPFQIKINGTGFTPDCAVFFNGLFSPVTRFKDASTLILSGERWRSVLQRGSNWIQVVRCQGAVRSYPFTFVP